MPQSLHASCKPPQRSRKQQQQQQQQQQQVVQSDGRLRRAGGPGRCQHPPDAQIFRQTRWTLLRQSCLPTLVCCTPTFYGVSKSSTCKVRRAGSAWLAAGSLLGPLCAPGRCRGPLVQRAACPCSCACGSWAADAALGGLLSVYCMLWLASRRPAGQPAAQQGSTSKQSGHSPTCCCRCCLPNADDLRRAARGRVLVLPVNAALQVGHSACGRAVPALLCRELRLCLTASPVRGLRLHHCADPAALLPCGNWAVKRTSWVPPPPHPASADALCAAGAVQAADQDTAQGHPGAA